MTFEFKSLDIPEVRLILPEKFKDDRGFFCEVYRKSIFHTFGIDDTFVQECISYSKKNILRGLHYQLEPKAMDKVVHCVKGRIFDVAVDIRKDSDTIGKAVWAELSEDNQRALYVPKGFAHGFVVLSEDAIVCYKMSNEYDQTLDRGVLWNDPALKIPWPIDDPLLSDKDNKLPTLDNAHLL